MSSINYQRPGTFVDDVTPPPVPINAQNLNNMADGIKAAADGVDRLTPRITNITATGTTALANDSRDEIVVADATLGNIIVQLPNAVGKNSKRVTVKGEVIPAAFTLTVSALAGQSPAQTIDGVASVILAQGQVITLAVVNGSWVNISSAGGSSGSASFTSIEKWSIA